MSRAATLRRILVVLGCVLTAAAAVGAMSATAGVLDDTVGQVKEILPTEQVLPSQQILPEIKPEQVVRETLPQAAEPVEDVVDQLPSPVKEVVRPVVPDGSRPSQPGGGGDPGAGSSGSSPSSGGGGAQTGSGARGGSGPDTPTTNSDRSSRSRSGSDRDSRSGGSGTEPGSPGAEAPGDGGSGDGESAARTVRDTGGTGSGITGAIREVVEVVPGPLKVLLGLLGGLVLILGGGYLMTTRRARRLARQRRVLLEEVGLLQEALLPDVPAELGGASATVSYRPADGPGAGGDFYDVFELASGAVAIILGDVSGHGRQALARTTLLRYTLRAYLDAGLDPRGALQVGGRTLDNDLQGEFATVVLAVFDPRTGTLTYASAGHPPPIVTGPGTHEPVTACSSPPIGVSPTTGLRQTRVPLPNGATACFFTDGLLEARIGEGFVGREQLETLVESLGPEEDAGALIERVSEVADRVQDDMAACVLRPQATTVLCEERLEELEAEPTDLAGKGPRQFLEACGVADPDAVIATARRTAAEAGRALLRVRINGAGPSVEVVAPTPETLEQVALEAQPLPTKLG